MTMMIMMVMTMMIMMLMIKMMMRKQIDADAQESSSMIRRINIMKK